MNDTPDTTAIVGKPIADLYPETTVMFADIKGFTQWSADRQPTQVFHLLETLYGTFDALAKSYGVFKVETIGDTYVAVVGLPIPRKHHAIVMVRFAKKCLLKMVEVTRTLEVALGPVRDYLPL
jgi:class 3 adenylate cyclase